MNFVIGISLCLYLLLAGYVFVVNTSSDRDRRDVRAVLRVALESLVWPLVLWPWREWPSQWRAQWNALELRYGSVSA